MNEIKSLRKINAETVRKEFLIPEYLTKCYKNRQEAISLDELDLEEEDILSVRDQKA